MIGAKQAVCLVELAVYQRCGCQNVERILLRHRPFDLRIVSCRVPDGAEKADEQVREASLLSFFSLRLERIDRKERPAFLPECKGFVYQIGSVAGKAREP